MFYGAYIVNNNNIQITDVQFIIYTYPQGLDFG